MKENPERNQAILDAYFSGESETSIAKRLGVSNRAVSANIRHTLYKQTRGTTASLPYLKLYAVVSDGIQMMKAWIVDATEVRRKYQGGIEFTMGGHHEKYPFIPDNEVWLDSALPPAELNYTLRFHELPEHRMMKYQHLNYNQAHSQANLIELAARKRIRRRM